MFTYESHEPLVAAREQGALDGKRHGELSPSAQANNLARCKQGLISTRPGDLAYWRGYATTAWQIAEAISLMPIDWMYGYLPAVTSPGGNGEPSPFRFHSGYQGETEYYNGPGQKLRFRWARCPWKWSGDRSYWNYPSHEIFEQQFNGCHGLLLLGATEPVDAHTLERFKAFVCPVAKTGFYNHLTHGWEVCEPTVNSLSAESYSVAQRAI